MSNMDPGIDILWDFLDSVKSGDVSLCFRDADG